MKNFLSILLLLATGFTEGALDETPTPNDAHVLSLVNGVIGFYRYSGGFIPANKAYYEE